MKFCAGFTIRLYEPGDRDACLAAFDSNTLAFFAPVEREQFAAYLLRPDEVYLVGVLKEKVIACGGWYFDEAAKKAGLAWGMVERTHQKRGCGQMLLEERIRQIRKDGRAKVIRVRTTQLMQGFYARNGFEEKRVVPEGYGASLDLVEMEMMLIR